MKKCPYEYQEADKILVVNDGDPDLVPIEIPLPEQPPLKKIDGYGLPPEEQYWKVKQLPPRLKELNNRKITNREKWKVLDYNQLAYKKEIEYISKMWDYRLNGYWFFNNGKATWIAGTNFLYLNHWELDAGLPDYRNRDRKFFIFDWFCDNDPSCYGFVYPKFRREGATSKAKCCEYERISRREKAHSGSQSMNELSASDLYSIHTIEPWKRLPFFFQPTHDGTTNPKNGLYFYAPAYRMTEDNVKERVSDELESSITFKDSGIRAYDGRKLHFYHSDECGKTIEVDTYARWRVVKHCLRQGTRIVGKSIHTSTIGDMDKGGGRVFKEFCKHSQYEDKEKSANNQTKTGLYVLFISSTDGYDGDDPVTGKALIDKYGFSNEEATRQVLLNERMSYEKAGDYIALSDLVRDFPITYKECFRASVKACNFNAVKLQMRLDELAADNPFIQKGNFKWVNDMKDTEVYFESSEQGRFTISYLFDHPNQANKSYYSEGKRFPGNENFFVAGGDPYRFKITLNKRQSLGAGAVFMKLNLAMDAPTLDISKWKTHRFVCTYAYRPRDKNEFVDDMIKMCVYYGCKMFPEINNPVLWDEFDARGYGGYLYYRRDKNTGTLLKTPGNTTTEYMKETIFTEYHTYIEQHALREVHTDILEQCLEIENDMTDYDIFTAGGYALVGAKDQRFVFAEEVINVDDYYQQYDVK